MKNRTLRPAALAALCGILTLATGVAQADITLERTTAVEGVGVMAFGNMSGTTRTTISGDKSRTDSDMKMKSKIVGFLARNAVGPSAEIVRLDQDKLYHLNINKKEYTEMTFEQMHERLQKATDQMNSTDERKQPSAVDQSKCEWLPARADFKKTGEKAQFAGYDSERVIITAAQPCKDTETGSICEVALVLDQWLSTGFTESAEVQKFYKAYAAKMGLDPASSQDVSQRAKALFSQYKGIWTEIAAKMQNVKGYPVKSSFTLALGGAQCKDPKAQQAQQSQDNSDSSNSPSAVAGAMVGKLGGLFHKKKDDADAPAAAPPAPAVTPVALPPGDVALMTVSSQLVSVSTNGASPDAFTVPADFKKQELKTQ
ncbi:MAG: hypothetical protein QOI59_2363 [Gammaproteobacteria bacterium]|jgi:hypothetical protein|nr:hypothetical protein [Gammaproteobacteria bacterium]